MKLILKEDVPKLGESGDEVKVKPGFARNFLIPRGIADVATPRNVKLMQHKKRLIQRQIDAARAEVEAVKTRLAELNLRIAKPSGENERLFGSVTTRDIEKALLKEGVTLDRRRIEIAEPIKTLGEFTVQVKLFGGEAAPLKVTVIQD
ncbi:MAG: 50S ribosomal protein L9 [Myxococcales bacterium]|jgi:large subunit ribosomal protein L9|nr:50S ribosomal protein L9 [Myxococcales bacterium]